MSKSSFERIPEVSDRKKVLVIDDGLSAAVVVDELRIPRKSLDRIREILEQDDTKPTNNQDS